MKKRKMKGILVTFIIFIMCICWIQTGWAKDEFADSTISLEWENEVYFVNENSVNELIKSGECGQNAKWELDGSGTLKISGTGEIVCGWSDVDKSKIVNVIVEKGITSIGDATFDSHSYIRTIKLPETLRNIGFIAFHECCSLESIIIPESVINIKEGAFACCCSLATLKIPNGIKSIENDTFSWCGNLKTVIIPNTVEYIGSNAFWCDDLRIVEVPASVKSIQYSSFLANKKLEKITFYGKDCIIPLDDPFLNENVIISGYTGSMAEAYAKKYSHTFVALDIPVVTHTEVVDKAVPATCTKTGLTEGSHCSVCGEVLVAQKEVAAFGHTKAVDAGVSATCTKTGLTEGSHCAVCGEVLVAQKEVAAFGHTKAVDAGVLATCTKSGVTEGSHCSVCGEVLVAQNEIVAKGHNFGEWITVKESTTTETGLCERICIFCDEKEQKILEKKQIVSLKKPELFSVKVVSGKKLKISWEEVPNATGYGVYRKIKGGSWSKIKTISSPSITTYTDATPVAGTKYYYRVRAYRKSKPKTIYSSYSNYKGSAAKTAPPILKSATPVSYNKITITWDSVSYATGYRVYRKTGSGSWKVLKEVSSKTLTYTDTTAITGTSYKYTVGASYISSGKTLWGEYNKTGLSVKTILNKASVTSLKTYSTHKNILKWLAVDGATGYQIYVKEGINGTYKKFKTVSSASYTHSNLKKGTKYYYKIRPYRKLSSGTIVYGSYSSAKSITCK